MLTQTSNFCLKPDLLKSLLDPHDIHHEGKNRKKCNLGKGAIHILCHRQGGEGGLAK